jgi:hypothetical protein
MAKATKPAFEIALDPHRPGRHRARLEPYGVAVWAVIAHFQGVNGGSIEETAREYGLPPGAVRAAIAYYEADPRFVDAFLLLNREELDDPGQATGAARRVGHQGKSAVQLLAAALEARSVFVTHDRGQFALLHERWQAWTAGWDLADARHPGILVISDAGVLPAPEAA